jgi:tetratricopeptide (TPR) repeat protein
VRNRLYAEAVDFASRAIELDEQSWRGWGLRGLNELRIGRIEQGRQSLEKAFAGDPYNVWIKNTLDLVDTFERYQEHRSERFELVAHEDEADVLAPYVLELSEEAYAALAARYRVEPIPPIRLEFYPSHADFSVRTIGLAGMGALGVCFGNVISQDSPRARPRGSFNWASTLWHELAHTFTMEVSEHRVPRWLTEGLSVLEERRARPGWGDDIGLDFLAAWHQGELLPVAELNNGFVRPSSPQQIGLSYYQASLVTELVERDWGFDAIIAMLHGYRDHLSTEEIFRSVLEVEPDELDRRFEAFLEEQFGAVRTAVEDTLGPAAGSEEEHAESETRETLEIALGAPPQAEPDGEELEREAAEKPGSFRAQLSYGYFLVGEERPEEAIPYLQRARDLFPQYAGADSAYRVLAKIHRDRGELAEAAGELTSLVTVNESEWDARMELADVEHERGEGGAAVAVLEQILFIDPIDPALHRRMAELYDELDDAAGLVRARKALVALRPTDMAKARFELAQALERAGRAAEARREVLRALEIAPAYDDAQRLLLQLVEGTTS